MPEDVTVADVEQLHIDAWKMGLKAVRRSTGTIARSRQPLSTTKAAGTRGRTRRASLSELHARIAELEEAIAAARHRSRATTTNRLPRRRRSYTFAFRVADCDGYVTVGEYEDGRPGEVFLKVSKQGSTLSGVMDAFAIAVSLGLQHGVPLARSSGSTRTCVLSPPGSPTTRTCGSPRALSTSSSGASPSITCPTTSGSSSDPFDRRAQAADAAGPRGHRARRRRQARAGALRRGRGQPGDRHRMSLEKGDAPFCYSCGNVMQRAGSCYACPSCGATSGCS